MTETSLGPKSIVYSAKSLANLKLRDGKPKATSQMENPRGIEERETATSFALSEPLTVSVFGAGYEVGFDLFDSC